MAAARRRPCRGCGALGANHWIPVSLQDIHDGSGFRFTCRPGVKFDTRTLAAIPADPMTTRQMDNATTKPSQLERLEAFRALGFRVPVRYMGMRALCAIGNPVGDRIFDVCLKVLDPTNARFKNPYHHLLDLLKGERAIAEQLFPKAPATTPNSEPPAHIREMVIE